MNRENFRLLVQLGALDFEKAYEIYRREYVVMARRRFDDGLMACVGASSENGAVLVKANLGETAEAERSLREVAPDGWAWV
jgi:hypothetical protein